MHASVVRTPRITGLIAAVVLTLTVQGGMLRGFHTVQRNTDVLLAGTVTPLETVTVIGHRDPVPA